MLPAHAAVVHAVLVNRLNARIKKHVRHILHTTEHFRWRGELIVARLEAHDANELRAQAIHARDAAFHFAERDVERITDLLRPIHHRRAEAINLHAGLLQLLHRLVERRILDVALVMAPLALLLLQRRRLRLDGTKTIDEQEFLEVTGTRGEGTFLVPDQQLNDTEVQELQNAVFGT